MPQAVWVFIPVFGQPSGFEFLVRLAEMALQPLRGSLRPGNWDERHIDDLTATGLEPWEWKSASNISKNSSTTPTFAQSLPEEGDCDGIWNDIGHIKPDQLLKGASVVHLELKLFTAEVE